MNTREKYILYIFFRSDQRSDFGIPTVVSLSEKILYKIQKLYSNSLYPYPLY